jgi:hypothetical protein
MNANFLARKTRFLARKKKVVGFVLLKTFFFFSACDVRNNFSRAYLFLEKRSLNDEWWGGWVTHGCDSCDAKLYKRGHGTDKSLTSHCKMVRGA